MSENDDEKKQPSLSKEEALKQSIDAIEKILQRFSGWDRHPSHSNYRTAYGKKWAKNDKLSCVINIAKKTVEFFLNNESMGIAFKDIEIDGNVYISLTFSPPAACILLHNDKIDINDESKWEIHGNMDINNHAKRNKTLEKINYDENANNVDELKEGDKVIIINDEDIIESEVERINHKSRKMLIRLNGWKWISMDSPQLFPSKDTVNKLFNDINENIVKLGRKFSAINGFPTATLKIPLNEITEIEEFKYDVLITNGFLMQIGFSDDSFQPNDPRGEGCGDNDHSWAFDGWRVLKWGKKSEEEKAKDSLYGLIPKDFTYDYKINYTFAITRALYAGKFDPYKAVKWFVTNFKNENIYKEIKNEELESIAIKYKDEGNEHYKVKKYYSAILAYDDAIWYGSLCNAQELYVYYSNRSISLAKIHEYELALVDALKCIFINKTWSKGYLRKGYALMKLRKFDESIEAYREGIKLCDKKDHKLLKLGLNTAIKYKEIMLNKAEQREKINLVVLPMPTEENIRKEIEDGVKKVEAIHIDYGNIYTFKDLISFDTFGWKLTENNNNDNDDNKSGANEDEKESLGKKKDPDLESCMVWECDNYPATLKVMHYKRECDIKKKPIDTNMFSIRHIQRDNLIKSGINSGLLLSENMKVSKDPEIYGVEVMIKTIIVPQRYLSGYIYWIKIPFKNEYFELRLETTYKGQTSGHRDSMMMVKISNELKTNPLEFMQMKIWEEDPYDSLYSRGALMNLSERLEYDRLFPYHPLSILRSKLMMQFKNSLKINSEKASKMNLL